MARLYAVALGAIALSMIAIRGAISGDYVSSVVTQGLVSMVVFSGVGFVIGAIADYLVCQTVEHRFRQRLSDVQEHIEQIIQNQNQGAH